MKINVYGTESYMTYVVRNPIEIETDNYPELAGMSEDEAKEYIRENAWDMKPSEDQDWPDSLGQECMESDILNDKITDDNSEVIFDGE